MYSLCQCDLSPWAVSRDQVDRFSKENGFTGWTETSVKENKNINEAMRWAVPAVLGSDAQIPLSSAAALPIDLLFLFLSKQEQTEPLEFQLRKVGDAVLYPEIPEDKGALEPRGFTECHPVIRQTGSPIPPFPPPSFSGLLLLFFFNLCCRVLIEKMMSNSREDMSLSTQGDYINLQTKPSSSWACC